MFGQFYSFLDVAAEERTKAIMTMTEFQASSAIECDPLVQGLIFLKITELERSIGQPTNKELSTNVPSHAEFLLFVLDSVRVMTCLVKSVFFIRHGWRK
jgi:hypothetical protein